MDNLTNCSFAKGLKSLTAFLLAFLMLIGVAPIMAQAQETNIQTGTPAQSGQPSPVSGVQGVDYIIFDGERLSLEDERIINIIPVSRNRMQRSVGTPPVTSILSISAEFANNPNVSMEGTVVSALRYAVLIDGISYEAFCADRVTRS